MKGRAVTVRWAFVASAMVAAAALASPAGAQKADWFAVACATASPGTTSACARGAVAASALQRHLGTVTGLGNEVPGASSTLGQRIDKIPRLGFTARAGAARVGLPGRSGAGEDAFTIPTVHVGIAAGIFDGFSAIPTVGGILSVDLLASTSISFLPSGVGFDDAVHAYSFGARVGVFRESFTVPGVTLSVVRRILDDVSVGNVAAGDSYELALKPSVTALRATVGKDLLAVGLTAGVGQDRFSGDATLRVSGSEVTTDRLEGSRTLAFVGASRSFLVIQLSAEVGWVKGVDPVPGYTGAFDPASSTWFGSVAFRLTL